MCGCFKGLLNIFLQDITSKEIPWVHRVNIEINIRSALSCGKFTVARDLLPKVQVLNVIRFAVETYHTLCTEANNFHQLSWVRSYIVCNTGNLQLYRTSF